MFGARYRVTTLLLCSGLGACAALLGEEPRDERASDDAATADGAAPDDAAARPDAAPEAGASSGVEPVVDASRPTLLAEEVVAGRSHTCALTDTKRVFCWGRNDLGQLGDGTRQFSSTPVEVPEVAGATQLTAGVDFTCALRADTSVACWGANARGQLGSGTYMATGLPRPIDVVDATQVLEVVAGVDHACARTLTEVLCWGNNGKGQLGIDPELQGSSPSPQRLTLSVRALSLGDQHSCAQGATGVVECWGAYEWGQLGRSPSVTDYYRPVAVPSLPAARLISAQNLGTCMVPDQGDTIALFCWGDGREGKLGHADDQLHLDARRVEVGATSTALASGLGHTCALHGGKVSCMGGNGSGQLGLGTTTATVGMHEVRLPSAARAIGAGQLHSCAVTLDGAVYCWGSNPSSRLGTGDSSAVLTSPTRVTMFGPGG